ncbi:MAG TPA: ATP-binding protein, partial [Thermoanaerobaculia bacterium]
QPLVENAIKHGMKGFTGPVLISVSVRPEGKTLRLRVQDNGRGIPEGRDLTPLEGIGISNVRRRLEALYPKRHAFSVHNLDMGGCEASVEIPLDAPPVRKPAQAEAQTSRRETA